MKTFDVSVSFPFIEKTDKEKIGKIFDIAVAFKGRWVSQGVWMEDNTRDIHFEFMSKKQAQDFKDTVSEIYDDVEF